MLYALVGVTNLIASLSDQLTSSTRRGCCS